jgi:hypothetical protein
LIDSDQPMAVLIAAVLHFFGEHENPTGILRRLRERMAPGSYLVISHILDDPRPHEIGRILNTAGRPWGTHAPASSSFRSSKASS